MSFTFRDLEEHMRAMTPTREQIERKQRNGEAIIAHGKAAMKEIEAMRADLAKRGFPGHKLALVECGFSLFLAYRPLQGGPTRRLSPKIPSVRARFYGVDG